MTPQKISSALKRIQLNSKNYSAIDGLIELRHFPDEIELPGDEGIDGVEAP